MTNSKRIFIDLDGVLANWTYHYNDYACNHTATTYPSYDATTSLDKENYSYSKYLKRFGKDFWKTIPLMPWGLNLYNFCKSYCDNVFILTSPSDDGSSAHGKMDWIYKYLKTNRFIITPHKYLLADSDSLLIDDSPKKINKFIEHGGHGFLFLENGDNLQECYNTIKCFVKSNDAVDIM